jgi:hypothetical protein
MSEPFDPFSYHEDDINLLPPTPSPNSKSHGSSPSTDNTSKTINTAHKRVQHQHKQQGNNDLVKADHLEELPLSHSRSTSNTSNRLPPKLKVKLSHHEEVSSSSLVQKDGVGDGSGGSLSKLFVTGKIMVSVLSHGMCCCLCDCILHAE